MRAAHGRGISEPDYISWGWGRREGLPDVSGRLKWKRVREGQLQPGTHGLWCFDEDLCSAKLVLVRIHVDRLEQVQNSLPLLPLPGRPGLGGQDGIPSGRDMARLVGGSPWGGETL